MNEELIELGKAISQTPEQNNNGAIVIDRGDYTVITIKNPSSLYLNKDSPGNGIDYFVGDEIVVNGPLFNDNKEPVGGYIKNGEIKKEFIDPKIGGGNFADTNGVIGQKKDGSYFLLTYEEWQNKKFKDEDVSWAFQNGPILVDNGNIPHNAGTPKKDLPRTAIGFNQEGELVIINTKAPTNMYAVGEYLKNEGVNNGIYLDGANVGYLDNGKMYGNIVDGSTTIHITQKPSKER